MSKVVTASIETVTPSQDDIAPQERRPNANDSRALNAGFSRPQCGCGHPYHDFSICGLIGRRRNLHLGKGGRYDRWRSTGSAVCRKSVVGTDRSRMAGHAEHATEFIYGFERRARGSVIETRRPIGRRLR